MQWKYFNNEGHPTAIYIPEGMYYKIEQHNMPPSCFAGNGVLEVSDGRYTPYAKYDSKAFPGAVESKGETIVTAGSNVLKFNGHAVPEGYKVHCIDEDWDANTLPNEEKIKIPLRNIGRTCLENIIREAKKVNQ